MDLLSQNCFSCHGPQKQKSDLRLDSREAILKGGTDGPAMISGDPERSLLIRAIRQTGDLKMPPKGKLPDEAIELLADWIRSGAAWPGESQSAVSGKPDPATLEKQWAFQPVGSPDPPQVNNEAWVRNPVDRFILARLEAAALSPAPEADRATLIRRLSFDLIGLPPAPEDLRAFMAD
ncbi:DUF1549 domain-containing protein, partial [Candidatus Sumerlaeota bacterium]|nr:DUF1549 domain-containing protein [Candidatus Sumerlaeota bacterium]